MLPALNRWLASDKAIGQPAVRAARAVSPGDKEVGQVKRPQQGLGQRGSGSPAQLPVEVSPCRHYIEGTSGFR